MREPRLVLPVWTIFLMVLMFTSQVFAHGVEGTVEPGGLAVACRYSTGEAMSYAKVTVLSPATPQTFQVGNTDRNGRFCFYPDTPGEWRVTADDGMGHRLEVKIPVTTDGIPQEKAPEHQKKGEMSKPVKVLVGLSLIFGFSGLVFYWKARGIGKALR